MISAVEIIKTLEAGGFTLASIGNGKLHVKPAEQLTAEVRELILENKAGILRELRRRQVLAMLAADPFLSRAYVVDPDCSEAAIVTLAIRGVALCELEIPREKWNPIMFMKFLEVRTQ